MSLVIGFVIGSLLSSLVIGWHHREDCGACRDLIQLREENAGQLRQIQELNERLAERAPRQAVGE